MARDKDSGFGGRKAIDDERSERDESEHRPARELTNVDPRCQRKQPVDIVQRVLNGEIWVNRTGDAAESAGEGKEASSEGAG
jgi:hypothetical protein